MTKTITYCDVCKRAIEDPNHITKIQIMPSNHARQVPKMIDACDTCATRILRMCFGDTFN